MLRNEKHCGDVLARKTYTPNYKDHKSKKNNGKKNKYFQPDHHEAIVSRTMWNAAQRILNSRKYGHEGTYLPMRIIDHGPLTGFISMNRSWAGFDFEDYYRAGQIVMGILDEDLEVDLASEYLPEGGRRIGGLVDDHGIAQIARDLTAAEQEIKDELEGKSSGEEKTKEKEEAARSFQVVSGDMFSRVYEPSIRITTAGISFNKSCTSKMKADFAEFLFNPVERMVVVRPCKKGHPNAFSWNRQEIGTVSLAKILYNSMGWDTEYTFKVPCQTLCNPSNQGEVVLVFDLDNYIGQTAAKKEEAIIAKKDKTPITREQEEAKSYYYPPDEDEPEQIRDMEEKSQQAVELNKKQFGTPVFIHNPGIRSLGDTDDDRDGVWGIMIEARPLDITHTVDANTVDTLFEEIKQNPPSLPQNTSSLLQEPIDGSFTVKEE